MTTYTTLTILLAHFIADFVFQTDKQAVNKSKSNLWLTYHVGTYTLFFFLFGLAWKGLTFNMVYWVLLNGAFHWCTDFVTSRINSYLWRKEMRHWFFVGIGADQFIHYTCLLISYEIIFI